MTDIEAESWVVGIERDNGMIGTITSESYINPKEISNVYIAVLSNGDENEFEIYESSLTEVARYPRSMGPEIQYSTTIQGEISDSGELWLIEFNVFEYPKGAFNMSQILHSETISIYDGDPGELIDQLKSEY